MLLIMSSASARRISRIARAATAAISIDAPAPISSSMTIGPASRTGSPAKIIGIVRAIEYTPTFVSSPAKSAPIEIGQVW